MRVSGHPCLRGRGGRGERRVGGAHRDRLLSGGDGGLAVGDDDERSERRRSRGDGRRHSHRRPCGGRIRQRP